MMTSTLVLTLDHPKQLQQLFNDDGEFTLTCSTGKVVSLILQEDAVLIIRFKQAEIRLNLSLEEIKQLRDDQHNLLW